MKKLISIMAMNKTDCKYCNNSVKVNGNEWICCGGSRCKDWAKSRKEVKRLILAWDRKAK